MCMLFYLNAFPRTMWEPSAHREQKRALGSLELEKVMSHHVGTRNQTQRLIPAQPG